MSGGYRTRRGAVPQSPLDCANYAALQLFTWEHPYDAADDWLPSVEQVIDKSRALTGVTPSEHDARMAIGWASSLRPTGRRSA